MDRAADPISLISICSVDQGVERFGSAKPPRDVTTREESDSIDLGLSAETTVPAVPKQRTEKAREKANGFRAIRFKWKR